MTPRFGALRHREYRLLWCGLVVSNVGSWMNMVAMGWLVYSLTDSPFWLGMVGFARAVPVFTITLWAGVLADRVDRRKVMLIANGCVAVLALLLGTLVVTDIVNVYLVLVIALVTASAWSVEVPSRQSLVPDLVPRREMVNAIGLQSAAFNGAGIVGPPLAALVIGQVGMAGSFFMTGLFSLAVVVSLLLMKPVKQGSATSGGALGKLIEGFQYVRRTPVIAALFGMMLVLNLLGRPFFQLMPAFARDVLDSGAAGLGTLMGAFAAGGLIGAVLVANVSAGGQRGTQVVWSGVMFALLLMLFAFSHWFLLSAALCFLMGLSQNFFFASTNTMIQTNGPGELRGRLMSMYAFIMMGVMPLGSTLLGAYAELTDVSTAVAQGAIVCLLVVLLVSWKVPGVRALA